MTTKATSEWSARFEAHLRGGKVVEEPAYWLSDKDAMQLYVVADNYKQPPLDPTTPKGALEAMELLNLASTPFYVDLEIPLRATGIQKWRVWELGHPMQTPWFPSLPEAVADRWNTAATRHARKGEKDVC